MIFQALNSYYERLATDNESGIPPFGTSLENISFALVLADDGTLQDIEDLRDQEGKKKRPAKIPVPAAEKRASGVKANFLWDNTSYVLGLNNSGNQERIDQCHLAFIEYVKSICDESDPGFRAVMAFLDGQKGKAVSVRDDWPEICGTNLVFRLDGVPGFIHDRPAAQRVWQNYLSRHGSEVLGQCLITGAKKQPLARLHPSIKGVFGAQSSGASIVSFNKKAFESYAKTQSFNAPVSQQSTFAYTTALNSLLARGSRQKVQIGDMTMVFWAECQSPAEEFLADLFDPPVASAGQPENMDDPQTSAKIRALLQAIRDGRPAVDIVPGIDDTVQFYILGLSPNAARLSVRFWEVNNLGKLLRRIGKHFEQLSIVRQFDNEPEFPSFWRLLSQTATLGKSENVSPVLAGGMARAVLTGKRYPQNLLAAVLSRIRSEHNVTYYRAALLKAFLIRNKHTEVPMALNFDRKDMPYLLGRLFAVLEKAQEEAIPNTNATIKDQYFGSASATPGQVFHMLLKNSANHIAKLRKDSEKKGRAIHFEILIQDIIDKFEDYPSTLSAEDQGIFMIGYYHQRKHFFTKKNQEV